MDGCFIVDIAINFRTAYVYEGRQARPSTHPYPHPSTPAPYTVSPTVASVSAAARCAAPQVRDPRAIRNNYMCGPWFTVDVVAGFPTGPVPPLSYTPLDSSTSSRWSSQGYGWD